MGNSPTFDWHMTNLRNYVNLSPLNVPPVNWGEKNPLEQFGEGSGLLGLPGDFTPPSRFVRAAVFSKTTQAVLPAETGEQAVLQAFHILNNFDIPKGSVRPDPNSETPDHYDYTMWTSACDLQSKRFYLHTYESRLIRMVDLMNCDLDAQNIVSIDMSESEHIQDVTNQATPGL
jgi:choloylglycine hydrolase